MRGHHFLPSHYLWSLNCVVFAQACQTLMGLWIVKMWGDIAPEREVCLQDKDKADQGISDSRWQTFLRKFWCLLVWEAMAPSSDKPRLRGAPSSASATMPCFNTECSRAGNGLTWQQDGAPPHSSDLNIRYLANQFGGRLVARRSEPYGGRDWAARSPDSEWVCLRCLDGTGSKFWFRNTCEKV